MMNKAIWNSRYKIGNKKFIISLYTKKKKINLKVRGLVYKLFNFIYKKCVSK